MSDPIILCDKLVKKVAELEVFALQGLDAGEMLAIVAASGSGESTLLNSIGGLSANMPA